LVLLDSTDRFEIERIEPSLAADYCLLGPLLPGDLPDDLCRLLRTNRLPIDLGIQGLVRDVYADGTVVSSPTPAINLPPLRILSGDEKEIAAFAGGSDTERALRSLTEEHAVEAVATRGDRGANISVRGQVRSVEIAAVPAKGSIRHPIGLGDTFLAVYGWERFRGSEVRVAGERAAGAATDLLVNGLADE
jgi:sugar/nucleoside kinase (ribokinase family)